MPDIYSVIRLYYYPILLFLKFINNKIGQNFKKKKNLKEKIYVFHKSLFKFQNMKNKNFIFLCLFYQHLKKPKKFDNKSCINYFKNL